MTAYKAFGLLRGAWPAATGMASAYAAATPATVARRAPQPTVVALLRCARAASSSSPSLMRAHSLPSSAPVGLYPSGFRNTFSSSTVQIGRRNFTSKLKRKCTWERPYGDHPVSVSYKGIGEPETGVIVTEHGLGCSRELTLITMKKEYWPGEIEMSRRVAEYFPKWLTTKFFPSWLPLLKGRVSEENGEFSVLLNGTDIEIVRFSQPLFTSENDGWRYQIRGGFLAMQELEEREGWQEFNCHSFYPDESEGGYVRVWLHSSLEDFRSRIVGSYNEETNEKIFQYRKLAYKYTELRIHEFTMARFHRFIRNAARDGRYPVLQ
mmetsp:Transcript_27230/g.66238  ORF Transcript_27230/g.66238 Transcript_27230/m.66238 type:complete len:322 (-) Transcript_27230:226-1191(-)